MKIAFEITDIDIMDAVKKEFDEVIDPDQAMKIMKQLDLKDISDFAALNDDMEDATNRAIMRIAWQIQRKNISIV